LSQESEPSWTHILALPDERPAAITMKWELNTSLANKNKQNHRGLDGEHSKKIYKQ